MRKYTAIALLLTAMLAGCANVDGETPNNPSGSTPTSASDAPLNTADTPSKPVEFTSTFEESGTEEFPTKCKIYKQIPKTFTEEQLLAFFSETPERTYYSETEIVIYDAETESGNVSKMHFVFSTNAGTLAQMAYDTVGTLYVGEQIKNASLDFATIDEVIEEIGKKMTELGFAPEDWYADKVYTLTKDDLEQYKEATYNAILDNPYSLEEDEMEKETAYAEKFKKYPCKSQYFIDIGFKTDGIKMFKDLSLTYGGSAEYSTFGSRCQIYYSKDGFEVVLISDVCETESSEDVEIIAYDEAKELINKKYNDIIFDDEVEVNGMELIYITIPQEDLGDYKNKFETRPAYVFYCTVTEEFYDEMLTRNKITYFDAVTGNEIATQTIGNYIG